MNVLLTCAGRRNYLVKFFQDALGDRGQVFAADASAAAPALQEADRAFTLPLVNHPDYMDTLVAICQQHEVHLLLSLNDVELPLLARKRSCFVEVGTLPVISSPGVVDTCFDKWVTMRFLRRCGLRTPRTYTLLEEARDALSQKEIAFPLAIKPRWGSASIGIEYPEDEEELGLAYRLLRKRLPRTILGEVSAIDSARSILIQERFQGQEYGLDVINDLNGRYVTTFAKRKLAMRAGETDRAITIDSDQLTRLGETIGRTLGHVGNLDCDVFVDETGCFVLEMNPRFGGGYPFSHAAGADLPSALIAWANREEPDSRWLTVQSNVMAAKCDRLVVVEKTSD